MRKLYATARELNFILEYYITENDGVRGIEVVKKYEDGKVSVSEKSVCEKICWNVAAVQRIAEMLAKNTVTPVGLSDVLEDIE